MPVEKLVRTKTVGVRLDPKIHYLAELAARYQQRTLSGFIEWAVTRALTPGTIQENEPALSEEAKPLWMEGLWSVDEAERTFLLASRPDLMTIEQQRFFRLFMYHVESVGEKANLAAFRKFWESPDINTSHLSEGVE